MKSGSWSSFQAALPPEARVGGEPDDAPSLEATKDIPVTIIAEVDGDAGRYGRVLYRVACDHKGLSPVYVLNRHTADGNPYLLYGEQAAQWVGAPSWDRLKIVVAQITSGTMRS